MSKSIISNERVCVVCGDVYNLHRHHIYYGSSNRKQSEKYGCWCYLCARHHNMSNEGVHFNKSLDMELKKKCQEVWEQTKTRESFMQIFGRNYL